MNISEAKEALGKGKKLTHAYFLPNEYIYLKNGEIHSEDGVIHTFFWETRLDKYWDIDWDIYDPEKAY